MPTESQKAIAIVSGGMDSVTLAHLLKDEGYDLHLLSFNYGQRHKKELRFAQLCAQRLGARHSLIDLSAVTPFLTGSSLTDNLPVPDGHYAEESMKITVVPNRNAMMLAIAYAVAVSEGAAVVATGVHAGDHFIYPDCRPDFIAAFDAMERLATEGFARPDLKLYAPFVHLGKHDIARIGADLGVPFEQTWSCYKGGEVHCGRCGTCVERREALELSGVPDPTQYAL
jgi:7-cyano-7-deazaguanine synthase